MTATTSTRCRCLASVRRRRNRRSARKLRSSPLLTQLISMEFLSILFGCNSKPTAKADTDGRISVTAEFNHKIGPIDRGERYEDPLRDALAEKSLGETDGGGTMQSKGGEIVYIDV